MMFHVKGDMRLEKKTSDSQRRAADKWDKEHIERMGFTVPLGMKEVIQDHAAKMGESTNKFIQRAIFETIKRESPDE